MQTFKIGAAIVAGTIVIAGAVWFATSLGKEYPDARVAAWCEHAQALRTARMLERAHVAYRTLARADACDARAELADLRFYLGRRERLLEGARAFRRAAELPGAGRREALSSAFSAYVGALALDPYAHGGRRAFGQLVATYRRIDPQAPDCTRALAVAHAGLLPESRLYVSRALRTGDDPVCRAALAQLGERRADAYRHLRDARAHEQTGAPREARAAYAAALGADSSEALAYAGIARVAPAPLRKEGDAADDIAGFFGGVLGVIPTATWALLATIAVVLVVFVAVWQLIGWIARHSRAFRRVVSHVPILKGTVQIHVPVERPPDLASDVEGLVDGTLARLSTPVAGTEAPDRFLQADPRSANIGVDPWELETAFAAVPPLGLATILFRIGAGRLRKVDRIGLVLDSATNGSRLEQRWRVIDRRTRETLAWVPVREDELPVTPPAAIRETSFVILAGQKLRSEIRAARRRVEVTAA